MDPQVFHPRRSNNKIKKMDVQSIETTLIVAIHMLDQLVRGITIRPNLINSCRNAR